MLRKAIFVLFLGSAAWWWATAPGTHARAEPAPKSGYVFYELGANGAIESAR